MRYTKSKKGYYRVPKALYDKLSDKEKEIISTANKSIARKNKKLNEQKNMAMSTATVIARVLRPLVRGTRKTYSKRRRY